MRKSRQETAETRQRKVKTAAVAFRRNGIDGTGLHAATQDYLSAEFRDDVAGRRPFVALGSDEARGSEIARVVADPDVSESIRPAGLQAPDRISLASNPCGSRRFRNKPGHVR